MNKCVKHSALCGLYPKCSVVPGKDTITSHNTKEGKAGSYLPIKDYMYLGKEERREEKFGRRVCLKYK